jgi:DNA-binding transcriptional MerR regulator
MDTKVTGLISLRRAARRFRIAPTTLSGWVQQGFIQYAMTDGKYKFFRLEDIELLAKVWKTDPGRGKLTIGQFLRAKRAKPARELAKV